MATKLETANCDKVIQEEDIKLKERREKLFGSKAADQLEEDRFGIALSGGGIRSATINLGFLKTLNKFDILRKSDYLSTVSGGGYTGSFIQVTLKNGEQFKDLFKKEYTDYLRSWGAYLVPGNSWRKMWNQFLLIVGYSFSLIMSWISPLIILVLLYWLYQFVEVIVDFNFNAINNNINDILIYGGLGLGGIALFHYFFNILLNYDMDISLGFHKVEGIAIGVILLSMVVSIVLGFDRFTGPEAGWSSLVPFIGVGVLLIFLGIFTNPNSTSFHRFYRKRLADAFLNFGGSYKNVLLNNLFQTDSKAEKDYLAPYPLVNTCLNLQSSNDPNFKGSKSNDYFLLSPLYCGAKLTGYVSTKSTYGYSKMSFPAAVTVSAAAVNPGMGIYSNKILSVLTTILNLRLGYWTPNPLKLKTTHPLVWWPFYFLYELFSMIGTDNKMLNISDGGHIENLAVYELLRRKCKLIIAVDAGEDPNFAFADLENLTRRARNELGMEIKFRDGHIPEEIIRPKPSHGYSRSRFAIADIFQLWAKVEKDGKEVIEHYKNKKIGTFVYVKSSVTAPEGRPDIPKEDKLKYGTYKYKIYHPTFPHESTADQFFDPIQWESYYQLGQFIAADILGIKNLMEYENATCPQFSINELIDHFDGKKALFTPEEAETATRTLPIDLLEELPQPRSLPSRGVQPPTPSPAPKVKEQVVDKDVTYKI